jgi:hypothetical protein
MKPNTKQPIILIILILLSCFAAQQLGAKPKKNAALAALQSFEPLDYSEGGFRGQRISLDIAYISSDEGFDDGIIGPLPFYVLRPPEMTDHEFRETIIFVVDNISEAFN